MQPRSYKSRRNRKRRLKLRVLIVMAGLVAVTSGLYALDATRTAGARKAADSNTPVARNAAREAALKSLSASLGAYLQTHQTLPTAVPSAPTEICSAASTNCKTTKLYDANFLIASDTGLVGLPTDPIGGPGQYGSGYFIARDATGTIVLTAPRSESGKTISISR